MVVRIHPGQWRASGSLERGARRPHGPARPRSIALALVTALTALLIALGLAARPHAARAQVAVQGADTAGPAASGDDVLDEARSAQARFERERVRQLPLTYAGPGGECDERVGRLCLWYGDGHWHPKPESERVSEARSELLALLDSLQGLSPADGWILGQRVWYRAEAGEWPAALEVARSCGTVEPWWCAALEGLALHGLGRFEEAEATFERLLTTMDPERALEWKVPLRGVDGDARDLLDYLVVLDDGSLEPFLERLWTLADPLYLVDGNDRKTAHYARWTVATLKEEARNPHGLRWGRDLEEVTVRNGWEIGWERTRRSPLERDFSVIGHEVPGGRDYMPAGRALADPTRARAEDLVADRTRPRSLYTTPYAPVLLPFDAGVSVLPRGDRFVVVATMLLPEDTTLHARRPHPEPEAGWGGWPGAAPGGEDRIGLFAVPVGGGEVRRVARAGASEGTLALELPVGAWVISAESWSPERRRAGRHRLPLERGRVPDDVAMLSDLLLLEAPAREPARLEEALDAVLPGRMLQLGTRLAIAWEVTGLGFRDETLRYSLSVQRTDRGFFRRVGEFFGLAERPASLALEWEEPSPPQPGPRFRYVALDLPELEPGRYEIALTLSIAGRSEVVSLRELQVVEPG